MQSNQNKPILRLWIRLLFYFLAIEGVLFLLTGLFCWLAGWHSRYQYGVAISTLGIIITALGGLGVAEGWGSTRSFQYQYGSSASSRNISERARQDLRDLLSSYHFAYLAFAIDLAAFFTGLALAGAL